MTSITTRDAFAKSLPQAGNSPATRHKRPRLLAPALAMLPLLLAGCFYEEVMLEQTELVFESTGMVRHSELVEGTLTAEILDDIAQDGPAGFDIFADNLSEMLQQGDFLEEYLGSSVTPLGEGSARVEIAGRYRIDEAHPYDPIRISGFRLYRENQEHWLIQNFPTDTIDGSSTLCVTIEPGWAFGEATDPALAIDGTDRVCVDRNAVTAGGRYVSIQLHRPGG